MSMQEPNEWLPVDWVDAIHPYLRTEDDVRARQFLREERASRIGDVFPPSGQVFTAFELTPFESVRAVIVGQDPYHEHGQAHGLAFSTLARVLPPSLQNILAEYSSDLGIQRPASGSLEPWARNGVLLLNTVLTVRQGKANSHSNHGWEAVTGAVVQAIAEKPGPVVFLLWGKKAQAMGREVDARRHIVLESAHPSPLSAWRGFNGRKPFSTANGRLTERGQPPIEWRLGGESTE